MFLRSRLVKRGDVHALARLAPSRREPLLFLYPSWIRTASTESRSSTTDLSSSTSLSDQIPPGAHLDSQERETVKIRPNEPNHQYGGPRIQQEFEGMHMEKDSSSRDTNTKHTPLPSRPNFTPIENEESQISVRRVETEGRSPIPMAVARRRGNPEAIVRKVVQRAAYMSDFRARQHDGRILYQQRQRALRGTPNPDWRDVLSDLITHTPSLEAWLHDALLITVPRRPPPN